MRNREMSGWSWPSAVTVQGLERQIPEESVGHDDQLGELGGEIGARALHEDLQDLLGGFLPGGAGEFLARQLAVLVDVAHFAEQAGDQLGQLGGILGDPVLASVLVEQEAVEPAAGDHEVQHGRPLGERLLDALDRPQRREGQLRRLAPHRDLPQDRLLLDADLPQVGQGGTLLAHRFRSVGNIGMDRDLRPQLLRTRCARA